MVTQLFLSTLPFRFIFANERFERLYMILAVERTLNPMIIEISEQTQLAHRCVFVKPLRKSCQLPIYRRYMLLKMYIKIYKFTAIYRLCVFTNVEETITQFLIICHLYVQSVPVCAGQAVCIGFGPLEMTSAKLKALLYVALHRTSKTVTIVKVAYKFQRIKM